MSRVKTFDSTGLATSGRLYAGDLNLIQDQYADLINYAQSHGVGLLAVGDATLQLLKFGTGEMRLTGHVRTDGILRALGGMFAGTFTTTQRDAIPAGSRPYGLMIINSTTNRPEWNSGSDAVPAWQPIGITTIPADSITATELANGSVGQNELAANAVTAAKVDGTLKPSVSAAAGTEALRALGTTGATAGNDARLSDARTPTDGSVTLAKIAASLKPSGSAAAGDEALRAIGAGAGQVVAGNDGRLSDTRTPTDNTVTTIKVVDGNITLAKLAANSVDASKIVDGSVGLAELAADSVNAAKIVDGSVGDAELALSYLRASADGLRYQAAEVSGTTTSPNTTVNFPSAFGATPIAVVITNHSPQAIVLVSKSASSFTFTWAGMGVGDGFTLDYIAIGAV
jgi:hypothetical protein